MTTTERAARALDLTHTYGECGPRTMKARATLAVWLDGKLNIKNSLARAYCGYLESVVTRYL